MISTPVLVAGAEPQGRGYALQQFLGSQRAQSAYVREAGGLASSGRVFSMSNSKREGNLGPNDPAYYAPRERAANEQPGATPIQTEERRPRLTTEGPPLQPFGKPRRQDDMFNKAVAQAMQEAREMRRSKRPPCSASCRGGARAPASHPSLDRGGDCGEHRNASGHGHSGFATPRRPGHHVAFGRLAVGEILRAPGAAAGATTEAYGDPGRAGRQRPCQRSGAARYSRRRSAARRVRIHQRADGRRAADVRQARRSQRVARAGDGDFRRFGHAA